MNDQDIFGSLKPIPTVAGRYEANIAAFNTDSAISETKIFFINLHQCCISSPGLFRNNLVYPSTEGPVRSSTKLLCLELFLETIYLLHWQSFITCWPKIIIKIMDVLYEKYYMMYIIYQPIMTICEINFISEINKSIFICLEIKVMYFEAAEVVNTFAWAQHL